MFSPVTKTANDHVPVRKGEKESVSSDGETYSKKEDKKRHILIKRKAL